MTPPPTAEGLLLCERVIIDRETESPSCIGVFSAMANVELPVDLPFYVYCSLTDADGEGIITVTVTELSQNEEIAEYNCAVVVSRSAERRGILSADS